MSALDELRNKKTPPTELELCVLMAGSLEDPEKAAEDLHGTMGRVSNEHNCRSWLASCCVHFRLCCFSFALTLLPVL